MKCRTIKKRAARERQNERRIHVRNAGCHHRWFAAVIYRRRFDEAKALAARDRKDAIEAIRIGGL